MNYKILQEPQWKEYSRNLWIQAFIPIHEDYMRLKEYLRRAHSEVPRGLYGLYRSFLLKAQKEIQRGTDPERIIDYFVRRCGLDPNVLRDIYRKFLSYLRP